MRAIPLILASALVATPAIAQQPAQQSAETIEIPSEITDPKLAGRLADVMQVLAKAMLNLPIGEIQAAAQGRPATAEEKNRTVRDVARKDDPDFERDLEQQVAASKPMIEASMKALISALPAMMRGMAGAREELERATANLPRPDYPKR
jgi:Ni/Co efflux regulator RcnB